MHQKIKQNKNCIISFLLSIKDYCQSKGSYLVRIDNSVEDKFLQSYCKRIFRMGKFTTMFNP